MNTYYCEECNKELQEHQVDRHIKSKGHLEASGIIDSIKNGFNKVTHIFDRRLEFNNTCKRTLETYGNVGVRNVVLFKKPIHKMLDKFLNVLSLGKWNKAKEEEDFDKFYHTGLIFNLDNNVKIVVEKVEEVKISDNIKDSVGSDTQFLALASPKSTTMNEVFNKLLSKIGNEKFFGYSGIGNGSKPRNNCQDFIRMVCEELGSWNEGARKFIYQDLSKIAEKTPTYVKTFADTVTNLGNVASKIMGNGMTIHAIKIKKNSMSPSEMKLHAENIAKRKNMKTKELTNHIVYRVIPRTKFIPSSYRTKKVKNGDISIVFGQLK